MARERERERERVGMDWMELLSAFKLIFYFTVLIVGTNISDGNPIYY